MENILVHRLSMGNILEDVHTCSNTLIKRNILSCRQLLTTELLTFLYFSMDSCSFAGLRKAYSSGNLVSEVSLHAIVLVCEAGGTETSGPNPGTHRLGGIGIRCAACSIPTTERVE